MTKRQAGFSLIELMVAMTVTLIVSGAIYGLLASGSNAFRREPEVADRQQNIRLAMDLISRDVFNAGAAMPAFSQVFTALDAAGEGSCTGGVNGCGVAGSMGTDTDVLQVLSTDESCPVLPVCSTSTLAGNAGTFVFRQKLPDCVPQPGIALVTNSATDPAAQFFTLQTIAPAGVGPTPCPGTLGNSAQNGVLSLGNPLAPWSPTGPIPAPVPDAAQPTVFLYAAQVVRYRIAPSTDAQELNVPVLWRSARGVYDDAGNPQPEPGEAGFPGPGSPWQLVARGIEDLQVEYMGGAGVWQDLPPTAAAGDWTTLVRKVRITLSARVTAANLQGETRAAGTGPNAVRGELTTVIAPRAAFHELQMANQIR